MLVRRANIVVVFLLSFGLLVIFWSQTIISRHSRLSRESLVQGTSSRHAPGYASDSINVDTFLHTVRGNTQLGTIGDLVRIVRYLETALGESKQEVASLRRRNHQLAAGQRMEQRLAAYDRPGGVTDGEMGGIVDSAGGDSNDDTARDRTTFGHADRSGGSPGWRPQLPLSVHGPAASPTSSFSKDTSAIFSLDSSTNQEAAAAFSLDPSTNQETAAEVPIPVALPVSLPPIISENANRVKNDLPRGAMTSPLTSDYSAPSRPAVSTDVAPPRVAVAEVRCSRRL